MPSLIEVIRAIVVGLVLAVVLGMLLGCTSAPVKVNVTGHIPIDCGPEPMVQRLALLPVPPVAYYDPETKTAYARITIPQYENGAKNNKRIIRHFDSLSVVIRHYRACIESFNAERP
jgi:hypothetical protein